jgi:hypothetical protein
MKPSPASPSPSLPADSPSTGLDGTPIKLRFSKRQVVLAVAIAGISDVLCASIAMAPPLVWSMDLLTAVLLFAVLGWHWLLLPGLAMEAIPGLGVLPFWLLVVGAIVVWGTARPNLKQLRKGQPETVQTQA